jgi:hypothetical protein
MAAALRLRGSGGVPPRSGGWRELSPDELADPEPGGESPTVPG